MAKAYFWTGYYQVPVITRYYQVLYCSSGSLYGMVVNANNIKMQFNYKGTQAAKRRKRHKTQLILLCATRCNTIIQLLLLLLSAGVCNLYPRPGYQ